MICASALLLRRLPPSLLLAPALFSWDGYDYETSETRTLDMDLFIRKDHRFKTLVDVRECRKAKASLKTVDGGPLK